MIFNYADDLPPTELMYSLLEHTFSIGSSNLSPSSKRNCTNQEKNIFYSNFRDEYDDTESYTCESSKIREKFIRVEQSKGTIVRL